MPRSGVMPDAPYPRAARRALHVLHGRRRRAALPGAGQHAAITCPSIASMSRAFGFLLSASNAMSAPIFVGRHGFQALGPLDVRVGLGLAPPGLAKQSCGSRRCGARARSPGGSASRARTTACAPRRRRAAARPHEPLRALGLAAGARGAGAGRAGPGAPARRLHRAGPAPPRPAEGRAPRAPAATPVPARAGAPRLHGAAPLRPGSERILRARLRRLLTQTAHALRSRPLHAPARPLDSEYRTS